MGAINSKTRDVLREYESADEETLQLAARSAYDQNPDLMTPKELLLFVLFGYIEEPPTEDHLVFPDDSDLDLLIEEPVEPF